MRIELEDNLEFHKAKQCLLPDNPLKDFQKDAISKIINGDDALVVVPTGSGKSLCYQLPALMFKGITIVVTPLISLMDDQVSKFNSKNLEWKAVCFHGDQEEDTIKQYNTWLKEKKCKLLYVSPEKLVSPKFARRIMKYDIDFIAIDEAHCISLWGYDFRPNYLKILQFFKMIKQRPVIGAFTASATELVRNDIIDILNLKLDELDIKHITDTSKRYFENRNSRKNIAAKEYNSMNEALNALDKYVSQNQFVKGIIYCQTIKNVDKCYETLKGKYKCNVLKYHAHMSKEHKDIALSALRGNYPVLIVATNALGMGIDVQDIRYVHHFGMPQNIEGYYQEIGRAARDGSKADCTIYSYYGDRFIGENKSKDISNQSDEEKLNEQINDFRYKKMIEYLELKTEHLSKNEETSKRYDFIKTYFTNPQLTLTTDEIKIKDEIIKDYISPRVLYTINSNIANIIRNKRYTPNVPFCVIEGENKKTHQEQYVIVTIESSLSYFDLMVSDAVYTLYTFGKTHIFLQNILELLSGSNKVTMKASQKNKKKNLRDEIIESLDRLNKTTITMDVNNSRVFEKSHFYSTHKFIDITPTGKSSYIIENTPILYKYSEQLNGQLLTIDNTMLNVTYNGKPMPNSVENLMIRHYMARRYYLAFRRYDESKRTFMPNTMSRVVRMVHQDARRQEMGMLNELGYSIDNTSLNKKTLNKVQLNSFIGKIEKVLEYYVSIDKLKAYRFLNPKSNGYEMDKLLDEKNPHNK